MGKISGFTNIYQTSNIHLYKLYITLYKKILVLPIGYKKKSRIKLALVAQTFNPSTQEVEAGRSLEFQASLVCILTLFPKLNKNYQLNLQITKEV